MNTHFVNLLLLLESIFLSLKKNRLEIILKEEVIRTKVPVCVVYGAIFCVLFNRRFSVFECLKFMDLNVKITSYIDIRRTQRRRTKGISTYIIFLKILLQTLLVFFLFLFNACYFFKYEKEGTVRDKKMSKYIVAGKVYLMMSQQYFVRHSCYSTLENDGNL